MVISASGLHGFYEAWENWPSLGLVKDLQTTNLFLFLKNLDILEIKAPHPKVFVLKLNAFRW